MENVLDKYLISSISEDYSSELYNMDCIQGMKIFPDNYFELAVVDPPYGLGKVLQHTFGKENSMNKHKFKNWDEEIPDAEYFTELFRVSKNQIIWGGNYFLDYLPSTRGFITWDKMVYIPSMSRIEMAWTSFDKLPLFIQINNNDKNRIHLTQKPIKLYDYCIDYSKIKIGSKILDTHLGSGSSRISAYQNKMNFVGFEIDGEYCERSNKRFIDHISQKVLF